MPITETIKKGQIKRKVSSSEVEVLKPQTDADIVLYNGTIGSTTVTNVKDALDTIAGGIGVTGVKGNAEQSYRTGQVNLTPANLGIALDTKASGDSASNKNRIEVGSDAINVVTTDTTQTITGAKTFNNNLTIGLDGNTHSSYRLVFDVEGQSGITHKIYLGGPTYDATTPTQSWFLDLPKQGGNGTHAVLATTADVTTAINNLDLTTNVAPAVVSGSGNAQKIKFIDIGESNGIITAGNDIASAVTYTDGAIDTLLGNKVDKYTTSSSSGVVYGVDPSGTQHMYSLGRTDSTVAANEIVVRSTNGQIYVPETPTADGHAASKKYVDSKITSGVEYLGIVNNTTELYALDTRAGEGDWVRVGTQFTYNTETCHVGDILVCSAAKGSSTHATWDVIHTEVDTDTNTTYQATVGAGSGTSYAGTILLQKKELGQSSYTTQDTIKYINGNGITITPDTTNKTLTIGHSNSTTAQTTAKIFKTAIDAQGHITSATAVAKADLTSLGVADDSAVVHKSGDTMTGNLTFNNGAYSTSPKLQFSNSSGVGTLYKDSDAFKLGTQSYTLTFPNRSGTVALAEEVTAASLTTTTGSEAITVGSDSLTLVTRDTAQSISGAKNFTNGGITVSGGGGTEYTQPHITFGAGISGYGGTTTIYKGTDSGQNIQLTLPTTSGTLAITTDIPNSIVSGINAGGNNITSSLSGRTFTLGDSGVTAGTYSAIQVNAKGIAIAGGQILDVIAHGGTPNVVNGGWYFEELATA